MSVGVCPRQRLLRLFFPELPKRWDRRKHVALNAVVKWGELQVEKMTMYMKLVPLICAMLLSTAAFGQGGGGGASGVGAAAGGGAAGSAGAAGGRIGATGGATTGSG